MTAKYFAILTNAGAAKLANAAALGTQVKITKMGVGDGNGVLPTPDPAKNALMREVRRAALNSLSIDPDNGNQIIAEQIIPESEGGWFIREIGLYDDTDTLIAVANCPETYKPLLAEGSGRTQTVRMIIIVSSTESVTLKIDPSVVLATRKYVDDAVIEVKGYTDNVIKNHVDASNPHSQYLQIANALSEIKDDAGLIATVLKNLGISERFSGRFINRQIFTTPGAINYKPTAGTKRIKIIITGGGARGYGFLGWGSDYRARGAGGGAGATAIAWLDVDDTKTYPGVVGRGGDDTVTPTSSTFNGVLTAANGAVPATGGDGGRGGVAVGGDINLQGGDGSDSPGLISTTTNVYRGGSGDGGVSYWGGSMRSTENATLGRQVTFGAGGGGSTRDNPFIGNFGSHGVIYIEEYT
ncbi:phage tail protein [Candidatus Pantoea floridensis]|uniref:Phage tail-collar fibre protein n=1 Tax=Candidatus Pantoea floridensis TaxID=1938870 RepID=A0A286BTZ4_9GAMM|nr:phage tail protein [Pantoea floridensis]SOD37598.1 Phage tail-collar fibre protein [Pantoea floridensis]